MRTGLRPIVPLVALILSACASSQSAVIHSAPSVSRPPAATPVPSVPPTTIDATYVANELGAAEADIRAANTPLSDYAELGRRQQLAYHLLAAHPDWVHAVLSSVPSEIAATIQANLTAAGQIDTLNGARSQLPHWRIVAPQPPDVLLGYYREAEQTYGIAWQYLAAINLIETNMGRIQGLSSAGAQGPMQFMPATWATYGRGDVNNPHDAILAAGRYLQAAGAARNLSRAIYAYNNSALYVRAVTLYAQQMSANRQAFLGYYNWQVYVATTGGNVLLPEGFSG